MHPNPAFRSEDHALMLSLVEEVGIGMVFAATPDGPRVAHTPLLTTGDGALQFHLARGNGLARHLEGATALAVVNGPDAYISPRFYGTEQSAAQVPTWNYIALELEGRVRRMDEEGLVGLLETLSARHEARVIGEGEPWTMAKMEPSQRAKMLSAIIGYEMEILSWRPTFKLSQNKRDEDRARLADALEHEGALAMAAMMRGLM